MMQLYWVALKSIWAKEIHRFMRIWIQTLVPPVITMTLYFIIFGNLIGSRIGEMHGFTYMQFIVPGLIMIAVITNAYANVASSFFSAKFSATLKSCWWRRCPTHVIIAGFVGGGVSARPVRGGSGHRDLAVLRAVPGSLVGVCGVDADPYRGAVLACRPA